MVRCPQPPDLSTETATCPKFFPPSSPKPNRQSPPDTNPDINNSTTPYYD